MVQGGKIVPPVATESGLCFGPFRLEGVSRLWRGERRVEVRPRPLAVLRYLAERPGRLVTSEELLKQLWPGIYVTKTVLRVCVRELRQALEEVPTAPHFIETVGRQGYRFIAPITTALPVVSSQLAVPGPGPENAGRQLTTDTWQLTTPFVGREAELARLHAAFARAQRGERQVVFVFGEAGIGKTTLVDHFLAQVRASGPVRIGRGQCLEQHGPGEVYLPLLEALGQLCSGPGGEQVVAVLRRYAPSWLAQLPGMREVGGPDAARRQVRDSGSKRMMRESAEVLEAVAAEAVVVLVLEDLQWSDAATLEALGYLAQRRSGVRLQLIGTYRPAEVVVRGHRLRRLVQELYGRRQCEELTLELLSEAEVEEYLVRRFGQNPAVGTVSEIIYRYTDGNALFVVNFVDYLLERGLLIVSEGQVELRVEGRALQKLVPETLQQLITRQIEGLREEEQQLLAVASVAGGTFTAAEVAGVVGQRLEEVEEVYDRLANAGRLIEVIGVTEWPEGTVTVRYGFGHALYQEVLYEQLGQARRIRLHRQFGERKELSYGERAAEIAGELAVHFAEGRDYRRAVQYYCRAGETALRRSAYREVIDHCREGLMLLDRLPDTSERQRQELALRMTLHPALTVSQGFGAEEVVDNLSHARELCQVSHDDATLVSVLVGLGRSYAMRAEREGIGKLVDEELHLLNHSHGPTLAIQPHPQLGTSNLGLKGELTPRQSRATLEQVQGKSRTSQKTKGKKRKKLSVASCQLSGPNPQHPLHSTQAEAEAVAEECFLKAIEVARRQNVKSLELRAMMSLARLWHAQGKSKQARHLLAGIHGWFTEGFDTKDVQEAKALLDTFRA